VATRKKAVDFEQSLSQLEAIVHSLESGQLSLEEALKAFEKGVTLTRECQHLLKDAEQKVEILTRDSNDQLQSTPLTVVDGDE